MNPICTVVGARPNFMKMAPVMLELKRRGIDQQFVHTGQHYDRQMSDVFLEQLGMPHPDAYLGVGSGSHAVQTAAIMTAFESVCLEHHPELVIVAGDVNSTLACALVAAKMHIPVAHVEAGLRSFDRTMPEEINRVVTDHVSDLLFVSEPSGEANLRSERIAAEKIHFVGNTMIDSLRSHLAKALSLRPWADYDVEPGEYGLVTLHRPTNVDDEATARELSRALTDVARLIPLIFPIHPRALSRTSGVWHSMSGVRLIEPLGYLEFLGMMARAKLVITDSGGIQEETTALGVRCITVRPNTERPVTLTEGTNELVPPVRAEILAAVNRPSDRASHIPELWDGHAATRIVDVVQDWLCSRSCAPIVAHDAPATNEALIAD